MSSDMAASVQEHPQDKGLDQSRTRRPKEQQSTEVLRAIMTPEIFETTTGSFQIALYMDMKPVLYAADCDWVTLSP
ncbi:hypothetical protein J4Q44_G00289220 [Coregonus suidteri]|uniref:Uncharacterized protein n=1 Tax=Coregonus suidteri TaxID=861788 RepID=A0AAN8L478_9TELE